MYFALVTGHFQLPQFGGEILDLAHPEAGYGAISKWMLDHPNIYQAATLGVTVEHLGATMWTNDPATGQYVPTGGFEWGTTDTMQRDILSLVNAEQDAYLAAVAAVNASGWPDYPWPPCGREPSRSTSARDRRCTRPGSAPFRCARPPPTCCRQGMRSSRSCWTSTSLTSA